MTPPPMPPPPVAEYAQFGGRPPTDDRTHLKLLMIFHFVLSGLTAFFGLFPLLYVGMGVMMLRGGFADATVTTTVNGVVTQRNQGPPPEIGWVLIGFGLAFFAVAMAIALLTLVSGFKIKNRRGRVFSIVAAGVMCVFFPFGTTLGVFTIIVLLRDSVKGLYAANEPTAETA